MAGYANTCVCFFKFRNLRIALCLLWLFGLFLGGWLCLELESSFLLLMRSALLQPVSIVGLVLSVFLPLILTYFSILCNKPIILLLVCFLKAAAFGFSGLLISQVFDSASWLLRFLFLFSDTCFLLPLFILWFRRCGDLQISGFTDFYVCAFIGLCTAMADYFVISPFLKGLF